MPGMTIHCRPIDYRWFLDRLQQREPVTFSRWGDGEWWAACGATQSFNCDGHPYAADLTEALQAVLSARPDYVMGLQPLMLTDHDKDVVRLRGYMEKLLVRLGLSDQTWYNADVFHEESAAGRLGPLFEILRSSRVVVVGPSHLRALTQWGMPAAFIDVPVGAAFEARARLTRRAVEALTNQPYTVLSVSAGMTAEVILHDLHKLCPGHALIDFGSLWDPYVGRRSRSYMRDESRSFV